MIWKRHQDCTRQKQEWEATDSTQESPELDTRDERESCGILGEGGTDWKMAATSLHHDVPLDSEECHE